MMGYSSEPEVCVVAQSTSKDIFKIEIDLSSGDSECEFQF